MKNTYLSRTLSLHDGTQELFRFRNNYGASVVRHRNSYGGPEGFYELAVIRWEEDGIFDTFGSWDIVYDTPITNDVIGWLTHLQVKVLLQQISEL